MKSDSGGLGDIEGIFDRLHGAKYFTAVDLASGFFQIEIAEEDKHKTAFRDADGKLWEYNRCGFGLKILPAAFAGYVARALGPLKGKGVENWLDDILISSDTFESHLSLLEETLQGCSTTACQSTSKNRNGVPHSKNSWEWLLTDMV